MQHVSNCLFGNLTKILYDHSTAPKIFLLFTDAPVMTQYALTKFATLLNNPVTMICDVVAYPYVSVEWRKDNKVSFEQICQSDFGINDLLTSFHSQIAVSSKLNMFFIGGNPGFEPQHHSRGKQESDLYNVSWCGGSGKL